MTPPWHLILQKSACPVGRDDAALFGGGTCSSLVQLTSFRMTRHPQMIDTAASLHLDFRRVAVVASQGPFEIELFGIVRAAMEYHTSERRLMTVVIPDLSSR